MSERKLDTYKRWRNKTVSFRMSEEENELLNRYVRMSGLEKQEYLISRALSTPIVVAGTPKVYAALKKDAEEILAQLKETEHSSENFPDLLKAIMFFGEIVNEFKNIENDKGE